MTERLPAQSMHDDEIDRKLKLYPYVGRCRTWNPDRGIGQGAINVDLLADGRVYCRRSQKLLSKCWYALITRHGFRSGYLVKRVKLDQIADIERLRWRAMRSLVDARNHSRTLWTQAERRGRVGITEDDGCMRLHVFDTGRWKPITETDDPVSKLGALATAEDEALGTECELAFQRLMNCQRRVTLVDEVLALAFELYTGPVDLRSRRARAFDVNGRRYYCVLVDQNGLTESRRAWPSPDDDVIKI